MALKPPPAPPSDATPEGAGEYTVVARRYRPQQFAELIGQEHVAGALVNALNAGRVAHAYLFTGARGVGKTSAARILAKALNCEAGPTPTPCDRCESCLAVAAGEDVDVLEIDGASNNKVEEVRDLRQNVGFRPTRGRYKVYIIDEVHMLSTSAFNALLKTLEEPPPHVKFILATTDVHKIPITILSRCQRFDFAHVGPARIFDQLKSICGREDHPADDDALKLVARRANGSMRDSQSLLDQLLASSPGRLTAEHVHAVLGTAADEKVAEVADAVLARDPVKALALVGDAVDRGLGAGELTDQLGDYWRSLMLVACGGPGVEELPVTPTQKEHLVRQAKGTSLDTVLSGLDVLTTTKARMRGGSHLQVLLEMAVVRLAKLDEMLSVGRLLAGGTALPAAAAPASPSRGPTPSASVAAEAVKKNGPIAPDRTPAPRPGESGHANGSTLLLSDATVAEVWGRTIRHVEEQSPVLSNYLRRANLPAIFGPNSLAIRFPPEYSPAYDYCAIERNAGKVQEVLRKLTGQPIVIRVEKLSGPSTSNGDADGPSAADSLAERKKGLMALPLFKRAGEVLGAQLWHADDDFNPVAAAAAPPRPAAPADDPDEG